MRRLIGRYWLQDEIIALAEGISTPELTPEPEDGGAKTPAEYDLGGVGDDGESQEEGVER